MRGERERKRGRCTERNRRRGRRQKLQRAERQGAIRKKI